MAKPQSLTTEQALQLHKKFLQDVLQDVMKVLETGEAGTDRVIDGLNTYWNSNQRHRSARRKVQKALAGTPHEQDAERMGRPFLLMLRAELQASKAQDLEAISQEIYDGALEIALLEADSGKRDMHRRESLISRIRAATA